jgi:hypothetical protein
MRGRVLVRISSLGGGGGGDGGGGHGGAMGQQRQPTRSGSRRTLAA